VKLVLDEHYSYRIAEQLRGRGYDVVAVVEQSKRRELRDDVLFEWAQREGRVLLTENVKDFMPLHHVRVARSEQHCGLLLTSSSRFPRSRSGIGKLADAIAAFLEAHAYDDSVKGGVVWL